MWFGSLISVVSWFAPSTLDRFGEVESLSTIKAPSTLIFTEPGWLMVLSISAVFVRVRRCSWCSYSPPLPRALSTAGDAGWDEIGDIAGPWRGSRLSYPALDGRSSSSLFKRYIDVAWSHVSFLGCLDVWKPRRMVRVTRRRPFSFAETLVIDRALSEGSLRSCPIYPRELIIDYVMEVVRTICTGEEVIEGRKVVICKKNTLLCLYILNSLVWVVDVQIYLLKFVPLLHVLSVSRGFLCGGDTST